MQQNLSSDLIDMLKDNQKRIEEDNKYLKDQMDTNRRLFTEKELIWSKELMELKKTFDTKLGVNASKQSFNNYEDSRTDHRETLRRSSHDMQTPEKYTNENDINDINTMGRSDYITLHHPESASSKRSDTQSNMSRGAFDHFIKESNVMKDSLLKHM
jgi:hypothetical protein